jgi:hypothetical protein
MHASRDFHSLVLDGQRPANTERQVKPPDLDKADNTYAAYCDVEHGSLLEIRTMPRLARREIQRDFICWRGKLDFHRVIVQQGMEVLFESGHDLVEICIDGALSAHGAGRFEGYSVLVHLVLSLRDATNMPNAANGVKCKVPIFCLSSAQSVRCG